MIEIFQIKIATSWNWQCQVIGVTYMLVSFSHLMNVFVQEFATTGGDVVLVKVCTVPPSGDEELWDHAFDVGMGAPVAPFPEYHESLCFIYFLPCLQPWIMTQNHTNPCSILPIIWFRHRYCIDLLFFFNQSLICNPITCMLRKRNTK